MSKLIILIVFIIGIVLLLQIIPLNKNTQNTVNNIIDPTITNSQIIPTVSPPDAIKVENNKITYNVYYSSLADYNISLIPNFSESSSFQSITAQHQCISAINGGFYTTENKPLGLYKSNGIVYSAEITNSNLLTGYFTIDTNNNTHISFQGYTNSPNVIQSGPYIHKDVSLSLTTDEYARRSLIGESNTGELYIIFINKSDEIFNGPQLSEIPEIIFSESIPVKFTAVLNLDGGSASAYLDKSGYLFRELTTVGSVICLYK